jgi:hypothetical protein
MLRKIPCQALSWLGIDHRHTCSNATRPLFIHREFLCRWCDSSNDYKNSLQLSSTCGKFKTLGLSRRLGGHILYLLFLPFIFFFLGSICTVNRELQTMSCTGESYFQSHIRTRTIGSPNLPWGPDGVNTEQGQRTSSSYITMNNYLLEENTLEDLGITTRT